MNHHSLYSLFCWYFGPGRREGVKSLPPQWVTGVGLDLALPIPAGPSPWSMRLEWDRASQHLPRSPLCPCSPGAGVWTRT